MFYEKHPANGGQSLRKAYELTLQKFFHRGFEFRNRILVPVLPAEDQLPTYKQFVYCARENADPKETLVRRLGKRVFNLRARPVLGDSTLMAFGPGTLYQIDATVADDWIVSALDRSRRLGRPVVYLVVCPFSRLIAGVHVGLENPSFFAAGLALENATMDKVGYCAQFGIQISADEWPSHGLSESILADRGELEGYGASNLVQPSLEQLLM